MKLRHLLLMPVIGGFLFLSACSNPFAPSGGGSSAPEAPPEVKAAIDQYVAKINAHDAAGAGEFYEDDAGFHWIHVVDLDRAFGTGVVKVTPAHDFNDNAVGHRHGLEMINIFTDVATINDNAPEQYRGLDRFAARKVIVSQLEEAGLLIETKPHKLQVPRGEKSNAIIEPYLTEQWFVKIAPLAEPAVKAVQEGRIEFVPKQYDALAGDHAEGSDQATPLELPDLPCGTPSCQSLFAFGVSPTDPLVHEPQDSKSYDAKDTTCPTKNVRAPQNPGRTFPAESVAITS